MDKQIKGITIVIDGDTRKLDSALKDVEKTSKGISDELRQVERLLKLDPTNTELLSQKQKLLADAIANSKEKLDALKMAQEQANQALADGKIGEEQYRALQREVIKAEEHLKGLEKQQNDVNGKFEITSEKVKEVTKSLDQAVTSAIKTAAKIAVTVAATIGGLTALTMKTAEYADIIDKLSERTGISREELQRWKYAAEQSGANIETLKIGMKTLSDITDQAASGNKKARDAFHELGISMSKLQTMNQEELFTAVINGLADMREGTRRNALGNDLLGRSYTELLPLLNEGSKGMQALKDEADALGIVMGTTAVRANVLFGDTIDQIKASFGGVGREIATIALPMLQDFAEYIKVHMPEIKDTIEKVLPPIITIIKFFAQAIAFVVEHFQTFLPMIIAFIGLFVGLKVLTAITSVTNAIGGLSKMFGSMNPVALKTTLIILGVVGALTILGIAIAVITGKGKELVALLNGAGEAAAKIRSDVTTGIPQYATGTNYHPGGLAVVGEYGPELVELPRGSKVYPHDVSKQMAQTGGDTFNAYVTIDAKNVKEFNDVVDMVQGYRRTMRAGRSKV